MAEWKSRFATLSEENLNLLLDDKNTKSTKRATKSALTVFQQYLKDKKADEPQTSDTLADVLKLFYAEARKADGASYAKSTGCKKITNSRQHSERIEFAELSRQLRQRSRGKEGNARFANEGTFAFCLRSFWVSVWT